MFLSTKGYCSLVIGVLLAGCAGKQATTHTQFYNIDSLIAAQGSLLKNKELSKLVTINGRSEETKFTPDSLQWTSELEVFRQIDQVNKSSFREEYVVADIRDTNSNLMIREIKSNGEAPVSMFRLYFLRTPGDVRKIEATLVEENALYTDTRKMTMEFDRHHMLSRYRVEGSQKMVMDDSVRFVIAGSVD